MSVAMVYIVQQTAKAYFLAHLRRRCLQMCKTRFRL